MERCLALLPGVQGALASPSFGAGRHVWTLPILTFLRQRTALHDSNVAADRPFVGSTIAMHGLMSSHSVDAPRSWIAIWFGRKMSCLIHGWGVIIGPLLSATTWRRIANVPICFPSVAPYLCLVIFAISSEEELLAVPFGVQGWHQKKEWTSRLGLM